MTSQNQIEQIKVRRGVTRLTLSQQLTPDRKPLLQGPYIPISRPNSITSRIMFEENVRLFRASLIGRDIGLRQRFPKNVF